jgi:hypothetical protein
MRHLSSSVCPCDRLFKLLVQNREWATHFFDSSAPFETVTQAVWAYHWLLAS